MNSEKINEVEIFTDGACRGNPGPGGWGVWMVAGVHEKGMFGGEADTTNNRMELTAVIEGFAGAEKDPAGWRCIRTASMSRRGLPNGCTNGKERGWRTSDKKPVKNVDLWMELDAATQLP